MIQHLMDILRRDGKGWGSFRAGSSWRYKVTLFAGQEARGLGWLHETEGGRQLLPPIIVLGGPLSPDPRSQVGGWVRLYIGSPEPHKERDLFSQRI